MHMYEKIAAMSANKLGLPDGAWDSHVHVIDEDKHPFHPDHPYRPKGASVLQLSHFEKQLGVPNFCLVAVSVYGNDNSMILDALARLGGKARAVVTIDPTTITDNELNSLHEAGVRGVRLNLKTWSKSVSKDDLEAQLFLYANKIRRLSWVLQIYLQLNQVSLIHQCVPRLGVQVVIDHMASPNPNFPAKIQDGYRELLDLLERSLVWVKLSGLYRFDQLPDLNNYAQSLIEANASRLVWASDWPHTGGTEYNINGDRFGLQDFRKVDDVGFIQRCYSWCDYRDDVIKGIFVDNPHNSWTTGDSVHVPFRNKI